METIKFILDVMLFATYTMWVGYTLGTYLNKINAQWYVAIPAIVIFACINALIWQSLINKKG